MVLNYVATDAFVTFVLLVLVLWLRNRGQTADAESNRLTAMATVLLVAATVSPIVSWFKISATDVLASIAALFTFSCLLPRASAERAVRLAKVSKMFHASLMRRQVRERIVQRGRRGLQRVARHDLADGNLSVDEFHKRWRELGLDRIMDVP